MEATCSSKTSITFNGLYGVIFQKTELFITTVTTSNPSINFPDCEVMGYKVTFIR
jgi:hypothetical protein